jgi:hypothetical protein
MLFASAICPWSNHSRQFQPDLAARKGRTQNVWWVLFRLTPALHDITGKRRRRVQECGERVLFCNGINHNETSIRLFSRVCY